ncbi:MAG: glycoside hydrolase family 97 protein [Cyclonatronaceae bacterium]
MLFSTPRSSRSQTPFFTLISALILLFSTSACASSPIPASSSQPAAQTTHDAVLASPANVHQLHFFLDEASGAPYYRLQRFGRDVVQPSRLGFELQEQPDLTDGFRITNIDSSSFDETWRQVWGEKAEIRNHYNELRITLEETAEAGRELILVFRLYDDGLGFRYEFPEQPGLGRFNIMNELTEFKLAGNHTSWSIDAYQWNRFEYYYEEKKVAEIDTVHTPLTMRSDDGLYLSVHEAALVDYSTMTLENTGNHNLKANLMPWADGVLVKAEAPFVTPWRTIQTADTPGGLAESYLILNLNEPSKIEDTSWIEPAKYVGIWWEMHLDKSTWGSGPKHGATTENAKRYIDFAAEHGFDHVLVEGWNVGWDENWFESGAVFSFTEPFPDFDLRGVAEYARERGVRLMGHHETSASIISYEEQMEEAFALYEELGVRAVKMGYVGHMREIFWLDENGEKQYEWHHGQHMVRHHQRVTELAARHRISLNVHEGVKDTGLRRTWPNLMTREVAIGQEYNAWGEAGGNPPEHTVLMPFTRNLGAAFDYTPGVLDLSFDEYRPDNRVKSTQAKELALYVVIYSPLHMAADLPEHYEEHLDAFQFIKDVPVDWEDTRVLNASIGNYVTIARKGRRSDEWFLGSITDEQGRLLEIPLHFLDEGQAYVAEIYRDGRDADWETAPYNLVIEQKLVESSDIMPLRLAAGGGAAIRFRPATGEDLETLGRR